MATQGQTKILVTSPDGDLEVVPRVAHSGARYRHINDSVHGYIKLDDVMWSYIDTPQFQRLRDLKQLGVSYFVWPGASHNRFEHSIGTCHLANELLTTLKMEQPELDLEPRDLQCAKLAGLCHDLGHGPFSHVFDNVWASKVKQGFRWRHEEGSEMMFEYLVDDNNIDISTEDARLVRDLINPTGDIWLPTSKKFLYDVVANAKNSIDVDKFDYISRDCKAVGLPLGFQYEILMKNARVIGEDICYNAKTVNNVYELFQTRYKLHRTVYTHKTTKAIEYMITDALLEAESVLRISEMVRRPESFLHLTDNIIHDIEKSSDEGLAASRAILKRLRKRDLYAHVGTVNITRGVYERLPRTSAGELEPASITTRQPAGGSLRPEDIIVQLLKLNFAKAEQNPVDRCKFFVRGRETESFSIPLEEVTSFIPPEFESIAVRVYLRDGSNDRKRAAASAALDRWAREHAVREPQAAQSHAASPVKDLDDMKHLASASVHYGASKRSRTFHQQDPALLPSSSPSVSVTESPCPTPRRRRKLAAGTKLNFGSRATNPDALQSALPDEAVTPGQKTLVIPDPEPDSTSALATTGRKTSIVSQRSS